MYVCMYVFKLFFFCCSFKEDLPAEEDDCEEDGDGDGQEQECLNDMEVENEQVEVLNDPQEADTEVVQAELVEASIVVDDVEEESGTYVCMYLCMYAFMYVFFSRDFKKHFLYNYRISQNSSYLLYVCMYVYICNCGSFKIIYV